jgi:hypothetical protein
MTDGPAMEMPMKRHACPRHAMTAAVLLAAAVLAHAETSPYYIGVSQAFSYDSNVFRQIDAFAKSSSWSSTALVAGFDQPYGRQRFYATANVAANIYQQLSELDNTSYAVNGGWDWDTIERLSGKLYASFNQNLDNYGGLQQNIGAIKNIQNLAQAYGTLQWGQVSLLALDARLAYSSLRNSEDRLQFTRDDLDQASGSLGVRKEFGGQLDMGTGLTYTRGNYTVIEREFDRYDYYISANWRASGQSTLSGRLNYSDWSYTGVNPYDESGLTGWVRWAYTPTGKLSLNTFFSYDTLANSGLTETGGVNPGSQGDSNQLTSSLQFSVNYAATAKINVNAFVNFYARTRDLLLNPPPGFPPLPVETRDRVTNLGLGANWAPSRNWLLSCNLSFDDRNQSSNSGDPSLLSPYTAWGASCSAQFVLQ